MATQQKRILILGPHEDFHVAIMREALVERGIFTSVFSTSHFPTRARISWQPETASGILSCDSGERIAFEDISAVYWRMLEPPNIPSLEGKPELLIAQNDSASLVQTFLLEDSIRWVNGLFAYEFHRTKPRQLAAASQLGIPIPKTLITNDRDDLMAFFESNKKVIYKPVQGGAHTAILTADLLQEDRVSRVLALSPVTLQEFIEGTNIRTYAIGDDVFSAEIRSQSADFREDDNPEILPIETPSHIADESRRILNKFGMLWTAIDWRRSPDGEYVFLEANPSPMFYHFQNKTSFPIRERLIELLIS